MEVEGHSSVRGQLSLCSVGTLEIIVVDTLRSKFCPVGILMINNNVDYNIVRIYIVFNYRTTVSNMPTFSPTECTKISDNHAVILSI